MMTKVAGIYLLLIYLCSYTNAWAGQVILTMPDERLRWALKKAGQWHHCEAAGALTDQACLEHIGNLAIRWGSGFHLSGLAEIGANVEVRYEQE